MDTYKLAFLSAVTAFGVFWSISPVQAQTAADVIRDNPSILGLPGYVTNWETNINRQMWNEMMYGDYLRSPESQEPVIQYKKRNGQPTDQQGYILDVLRRDEQNLP